MVPYLPLMWRLSGKPCVVVGGGEVAERRAQALLSAGARLLIVSPALTPRLRACFARSRFQWAARPYQAGDAQGAMIVVVATDQPEVNEAVAADARRQGALVNRADDEAESDLAFPAAVHRGPFVVTAFTAGSSPALAAGVRRQLAALFPPSFGEYVAWLGAFRAAVRERVRDPARRRKLMKDVLAWGVAECVAAADWPRLWQVVAREAGPDLAGAAERIWQERRRGGGGGPDE